MRIRRRRRDYTPEQEAARVDLHRAETWVHIVASGIADTLKREHYCGDGMRRLVDVVNTELVTALDAMEGASRRHELAFADRRRALIVTVGKKNPKPKKRAAK